MSGRRLAARSWELDGWVRRSDGGRLLAGGAPARLVRLSEAGAAVLDRALRSDGAAGEAPATEPGGHGVRPTAPEDATGAAAESALLERLRDGGLLHPVPDRASTVPLSTVIPARNGGDSLPALVAAARRWGEVIVVDDRSTDGSAARAAAAGARVIANPGPPGPAAARNTGLRAAGTELVAFVDADCEVARYAEVTVAHVEGDRPGGAVAPCCTPRDKERPHSLDGSTNRWAPRLAALLEDDPGLALVAPRVRSVPGGGAVAHYERACSPLDMGRLPGLVGPGRRLGYVPSTALVARRSALLALGGFDEALRFGEDVDLVWRLVAAGQRVRYAPQVEVLHHPRPTPAALARQRFEYGRSAATLDRLHPGEAAPLRLDRYSAATVAAGAVLGWRAACATAALGIASVAARGASGASGASRTSDRQTPARALATVAARAQIQTARQLSRALVRDWLPLTLLACALSPRARRIAATAAAIDLVPTLAARAAAIDLGPDLPPAPGANTRAGAPSPGPSPARALTALALRPLDHAAYAAGLWAGAARARSARALLPRLIFTGR